MTLLNEMLSPPEKLYAVNKLFFAIIVIVTLAAAGNLISLTIKTVPLASIFVFHIIWGVLILSKKNYFDTEKLTLRCIPWLVHAVVMAVQATVVFALPADIYAPPFQSYLGAGVFDVVCFMLYRNLDFFRPYRVETSGPLVIYGGSAPVPGSYVRQQSHIMIQQEPTHILPPQQPHMMMQQHMAMNSYPPTQTATTMYDSPNQQAIQDQTQFSAPPQYTPSHEYASQQPYTKQ